MLGKHELDSMFYPRSVAVVGASGNSAGFGGVRFVSRLHKAGFPGGIYPVNPRVIKVNGLKAYPDVKSIPEPVDLVIVAVPAISVPEVLEDCISAGVKNVHIYSSGFSETREEEGRQLEARITGITQRGGLRVVGPNCMGIYVPTSRLAAWGATPAGSGSVAFLSQSGGHADFLIGYAQELGILFSKVVSFGNACGLQALDLLEYLAEDPETKVIAMYLEGIKDGNRVTQLVKNINRTKPVIVWKGGLTDSGSRAAASHTGSMTGAEMLWEAFFAQTGAIRVNSLEEIVDVVMAFLHLTPSQGRRTLLLGGGGGNSVAVADICSQEGLEVTPLSCATRRELANFIPLAGNIIRNPLDIWRAQENVDLLRRSIELAVADPVIDLVIVDRHVGGNDDGHPDHEQQQHEINNYIIDFAKKNTYNKPLVVSINLQDSGSDSAALGARLRKEFALAGVPAYSSQASATRALARFVKYHGFQVASGNSS
ncbi:acetate--CoA ligase family protein [Chloroflexota bacterium]